MPKHKIIIADDHPILRAGLKNLLEKDPALTIKAEAKDGEELWDRIREAPPDLVVLDISMPNMDGIKALEKIRKHFPKVKVLILTMQKDHEHFKHAMAKGAAGYLLKDDAYDQLLPAVKAVLRGEHFVSPSVATLVTERFIRSVEDTDSPSLEILTKREQQVLKLVASGLANKNIASRLKISVRTVEAHRSHLTDKIGIKTTAGLVKYAYAKGLI